MKLLKKLGLMVTTGALALGLGVLFASSSSNVEAGAANWVLATSLSDLQDGSKYAITYSGGYLIPGAYSGSNPSNGTFSTATAVEADAWTFKNVGTNQWRINDGTNWLKIETNTTSGLRTQTTEPTTYFTAALDGTKITLTTSSTGSRQITRYTGGTDWRSYAANNAGNELELYKYVTSSATLDAIVITGTPTKTTYYAGENFDPTGITVTAYYDDSSDSDVTAFATYEPSPLTLGTTSITVTFEDQVEYIYGITVLDSPDMLVLDSDFTSEGNVNWTATSFGAYFTDAYGTANKDAVSTLENESIALLSQSPLGTDIKVNVAVATNSPTAGIDVTVYGLDNSGNRITDLSETFSSHYQSIGGAAAGIAAAEANAKFVVLQTGASDRVVGIEIEFGTGARAVVSSIQVYAEEFETKELSSISITSQPTKKAYFAGESFDPTGMVITANYSDSSTLVVTESVSYSTAPLTVDVVSITISYSEGAVTKTVDVTGITVTAVTLNSISVNTAPGKTSFTLGEHFSYDGLVIDANYNSGTVQVSSGFVVSADTLVLGESDATITYEGKTTSYKITVTNNGASVGSAVVATELFISEYIEGSSNNKAVEIFNGTGSPVDLSTYKVNTYNSGATTANYTLSLSGTLANGDVYVIANSAANASILAQADTTSNITYYNGDDAVALLKNDIIIDIIGDQAGDPGSAWTGTAANSVDGSTGEMTLVRTSSVTSPNTTFSWSEWNAYAQNTVSYLGSHSIGSFNVTPLQQATSFANYVMTGIGNNAQGSCEAVLDELETEYGYMHADAKTIFDENAETLFADARGRMAYLNNWVDSQSSSGVKSVITNINSKNVLIISLVIGILGFTTISGFYFLKKKKEIL